MEKEVTHLKSCSWKTALQLPSRYLILGAVSLSHWLAGGSMCWVLRAWSTKGYGDEPRGGTGGNAV